MSEMAEIFSSMKAVSQQKRSDNREASAALLTRAGVVFESKNAGAHLVVLSGQHVVDFWPGTGLWIVRGARAKRRGARKLIQFVETARSAVAAKGGVA